MNANNLRKILFMVALLGLALAISPLLLQDESNSDGLTDTTDKAAEEYRNLKMTLEDERKTNEEKALAKENLARLVGSNDSVDVETDGKFAATFNYQSGKIHYQGTAGFVFVQGSGNCQIEITAEKAAESFSGRSVGCSGSINEKTGRYELSGQIITDTGRNKMFNVIGNVMEDGLIEGVLSFDGLKIELTSL